MSALSILSAEDRDRVSRLQLYARGVVDGLSVGQHRSPHKGFSAEFKEHRPYVQGDETRLIDWKLYGKTDRLFIRQYEEETNLRCTLLIDQSGSMAYRGSAPNAISKHEYAIRLAASLAYLLIQQRDAVGLGLIDSQLKTYVPPRANPGHLQRLMEAMVQSKCSGETQLSQALQIAAPRIRGKGVVVLISDCFDNLDNLIRALSYFRLDHSEVVLCQIWDRDELEFPFRQRVEFRNLESLGMNKMVDPGALRRDYLERVAAFRTELATRCARHRIDLVPCITDQSHTEILAGYIASRGRL
ncbi:MAG: DUF58 domain-containing protein [Pirellulaceae bacterium]|nr:DUF58 domain-containing protein [Pirellulaceae bacterium]